MKRFILLLVILSVAVSLKAQDKKTATRSADKTFQRCATDQYLQRLFEKDPGLKARIEAAEERLALGMEEKLQARKKQGNLRINAVVTIPVVVHIILPNPSIVTDADVNWQIDKLNIDFAGQNADSVNAGPFADLFGHSQIQFCLAKRDPKGNPTTGIIRVNSALNFDQNNFNNLKYASNCGADSWDPTQYYNIWVAESVDGTLGVATFPGGGDPVEQGIVLAHEGFGNNPAYVSPSFSLGRTAVHETGHFFFARHIWGDGGGCNSDFPTVSGLTGSWVDDTPTQSGSTNGCPTGTQPAGCSSPNPPGKMYQNYMDYTNDACYCMFTKNQVLRMETALDIFRNSLTTSDKCTPAIVFTNDASIAEILTPATGNGCVAANNTQCSPDLIAEITLKNFGSANLTSAVINIQIDNGMPYTTNWTGNLATNASINVTLPSIPTAPGNHTLKIFVTNPNGGADGRLTNDTLSTTFTVLTPVTAPFSEGFESPTFPPAGWHVVNQHSGSLTWERTTLAAQSGVGSARIHFFDYTNGEGHVDYLLSQPISISTNDTLVLSFDRAYQLFSTDEDFADSLAVVISFDCGKTFTEVWKRGGEGLATVTGTTDDDFVPLSTQWFNTKINLQPYITTTGTVIVGFKATNNYGNNLYIDNINIDTTSSTITDAQITLISQPARHECRRSLQPSVTIRNNGNDTLTKATIVIRLDNVEVDVINWTGNVLPGNSANVTGDNITIPAGTQHTLTAFSRDPNGVSDMDHFNDTARKIFFVHDLQEVPLKEGFENATFPPANWAVDASGADYSWERTTRAADSGVASVWIRNYRFNSNGKHDDLYTPLLQAEEYDSVFVRFDVAHAMVSPATDVPDTLEVLITKDCGVTFESLYKKWGAGLQTAGLPPPTFPVGDTVGFVPNATQWRSESINFTESVDTDTEFMIVFRNTSHRGNNLFLDNIKIEPLMLPARLKQNGFIITPNPFGSIFTIRHLAVPKDLRAVVVLNTAGQVVYSQQISGTAAQYININLGGHAAGMYHVKLVYNNRIVNAKVMKM